MNLIDLKVAFYHVGPVCSFQKAAAKELIITHSLPSPVTWPLTVQTASLSTVQDCAATFLFWAGNQLKKSTRNVVVDFSLIAPVVSIWMCFYLAMYSTDINVIECCCSSQPPLFKLKATECFLTHTCILFWKNKLGK